jgi:hypothetical protein
MPYTVTAADDVHQKLAQLWLDAPDQAALTQASNHIDRFLRINPFDGMDLGSFLMHTIGPLVVVYRVDIADRQVTILDYFLND